MLLRWNAVSAPCKSATNAFRGMSSEFQIDRKRMETVQFWDQFKAYENHEIYKKKRSKDMKEVAASSVTRLVVLVLLW